MKYLLIILPLFFLLPSSAGAVTGGSARFDFTNGQPAVVDNQTSTCNNQTTVRYDFTLGTPSPVFDTTATCTAAAETQIVKQDVFWFD